ncbi:CvpA family protein [Moraxella marmotae]|uniref:CvpA family protein n=1 Tax=Moraxella marmotae TaxID=3344520 RepID=UPI0035F2B25B
MMSAIDIVITVAVLLGLWRGFLSGLIKSLTSLVAWFFALIIASKLAKDFAVLFVGLVDNPILQIALAFLSIMLVAVVLVNICAGILTRSVRFLKLGIIDRLGGGLFGAMTGVLKVLMVMSVIAPWIVNLPAWQNSQLAPSLLPYAPLAKTILQKAMNDTLNQLDNPYKD